MKIFKFGGASVKNAEAVRNVGKIVQSISDPLIVVVSAMDKTTNLLEEIHEKYIQQKDTTSLVTKFKNFHNRIANNLFSDNPKVQQALENHFEYFQKFLNCPPHRNQDYEYDRLISFGELLSTTIIEAHLQEIGLNSQWIDVRQIIKTNNAYRRAEVDWAATMKNKSLLEQTIKRENKIIVTQGFIGSSSKSNETTTLGREGSDYTAAILAYLLDAQEVCIWKDVPGMLNADPKYFNNTVKLDQISYREALELSYYGASVIHPKTIKPIQNKKIPLYIKSFEQPSQPGSIIHSIEDYDANVPSYIFKPDQTLLSISPKDFSFIQEDNLSELFRIFNEVGLKINLMQNSALDFSVVFDTNQNKIDNLTLLLSQRYNFKYHHPLRLLTIRHYNEFIIKELTKGFELFLTQKTKSTIRIVMKNLKS